MSAKIRNWAIVLGVPLIMAAILWGNAAESKLILFAAFTVFVILVWALEVLPSVHAAILLPLLYVVTNIIPPSVAFAPWLTFLPWVSVAGLIYGNILGRTGLARRIALVCVKIMGGSFTSITIGLMIAGIILAFLVPAMMARIVIFYAVTCGFADALDIDKRSRMSSAILMAGFFAATSPSLMVMTGTEVNLLGINAINTGPEPVITWGAYFFHNFPIDLIYCAMSIVMAHFIKGKEKLAEKSVVNAMVKEKLAEMGKVNVNEIKVLVLLVLGVTAFVVAGTHMGPWLFVLTACLAFFPGMSLIDGSELGKLNFGFIFFVTGCMAIGGAAGSLKLPMLIADQITPILNGQSGLACISISYLTGLGLNFILTPLAATSSMSEPLVAVAQSLNMNPAPFIYSFFYGLEQYVLPYEYALFLFFFMDNRVTLSHVAPALGVRMVVTFVLLIAVAYPYWSLIGLL